MRHIILISGKDSAATAIIQKALQPELDYEYLFNQTGSEVPEVLDWLDNKMAPYLGKPITKVGANLEEIIYTQGILPSPHARYCTKYSKIFPLEQYLGKDEATVYYGIRADEERAGYQPSGRANITPAYPLKQVGYGLMDVWHLLEDKGLLPPQFFWESLYQLVVSYLGENRGWLDTLPKPAYHQLFAWRSRPNCSFCFYQRRYEFVGLLEHHPELFWQAVELEEGVGAEGFTLLKDYPLRKLAQEAEHIKQRRAKAIVKLLGKQAQASLFNDGTDWPDLLEVTSCGLYCGK